MEECSEDVQKIIKESRELTPLEKETIKLLIIHMTSGSSESVYKALNNLSLLGA